MVDVGEGRNISHRTKDLSACLVTFNVQAALEGGCLATAGPTWDKSARLVESTCEFRTAPGALRRAVPLTETRMLLITSSDHSMKASVSPALLASPCKLARDFLNASLNTSRHKRSTFDLNDHNNLSVDLVHDGFYLYDKKLYHPFVVTF